MGTLLGDDLDAVVRERVQRTLARWAFMVAVDMNSKPFDENGRGCRAIVLTAWVSKNLVPVEKKSSAVGVGYLHY